MENREQPFADSRREIDLVDRELVRLLARRMRAASAIGAEKGRSPGQKLRDPERERALSDAWAAHAEAAGLSGYFAGRVLREILNHSRREQERPQGDGPERDRDGVVRVGYQGIPACYSDQAVTKLFATRANGTVERQGFSTFAAVVDALEDRGIDYALLPAENSVTGSIGEVSQLLVQRDVAIVDEEIVEVDHCLAAPRGATVAGLRAVRSHPVALQQCQRALRSLPRCSAELWPDTAAAAENVAGLGDPTIGAVCSEEAARRHGLDVLRREIADHPSNQTRFLLLAREPERPRLEGAIKSSLALVVDHRRGALARCLKEFADAGINLTRLESRPLPENPWEYQFLVDIEGDVELPEVREALDRVARRTNQLRVLGAYPDRGIERAKVELRPVAKARNGDAARETRPAVNAPRVRAPKLPLTALGEDCARTLVAFGGVAFGPGRFVLIAGPCAVEGAEQVHDAAAMVKERGARVLRGGAFKPRSSPYSFQGLGFPGLDLLADAGRRHEMPVVTEVLRPEDVARIAEQADMLQVGARNMQNFALLRELGRIRRPILLKRGISATIEELLQAAEYVMAGGNRQVVLCERGIRTFETATRSTLDVAAVPVLKARTHLPVIVDPSHAAGRRDLVVPLALAAAAAGADGLIVEAHPRPDEALCDKDQALTASDLDQLVRELEPILTARGLTL